MQHTHLLTPGREPRTEQSTDTTKIQLDEPMHFISAILRNMGNTGEEITHRQLHHHGQD